MTSKANNNQVYVWHGPNDYDASKSINVWKEKFCQKYSELNVVTIDLESLNLKTADLIKDLKNAFFADSLFGSYKLIILKNFMLADVKKISSAIKPKLKEIEKLTADLVLNIPPGYYVIFWQKQNLDKRKYLYKKIYQIANIKEFVVPKSYALVKWLENEFKENNARVESIAIQKLILLAGNDLWLLGNEVKKLAAYKKENTIMEEDVLRMVSSKFDDNIFNLMDAISSRDKKLAVKFFYDQLGSGANEIYLLSMTAKQFKTLIKVKDLLAHNSFASADLIAKELKIHPYVAGKTLAHSKNFSMEQLKKIYALLLQMDLKSKTTGVKLPTLFDVFISQI